MNIHHALPAIHEQMHPRRTAGHMLHNQFLNVPGKRGLVRRIIARAKALSSAGFRRGLRP
jgi:hypothetical protein